MSDEKRAPVQGYTAGIPWSMHLRAYDVYCETYSPQPALIDLEGRGCRGGFGVDELDAFIPGWREELSEITRLKARAEQAEAKYEGAVKMAAEAKAKLTEVTAERDRARITVQAYNAVVSGRGNQKARLIADVLAAALAWADEAKAAKLAAEKERPAEVHKHSHNCMKLGDRIVAAADALREDG